MSFKNIGTDWGQAQMKWKRTHRVTLLRNLWGGWFWWVSELNI